MHQQGVGDFPYYLGIKSLSELATKEDKVVVLNMLGKESSGVMPISHEYSGGNVVFGTGPGKSGKSLPTKLGKIPCYNSIKEGMAAGHKFNVCVVYLPPSGVKDGVAEAVRCNPDLKKVIVLTEKVSVKDSRIMRAICQTNGVDLFGGNCLGFADSWNHIRLGGALGGNSPEESLVKGSVALFSNSGNFTTTIAVYLATSGWGTTTSVSSGKDVYIQYGPKEFLYAFNNDERSKAAVLYSEPGGYYEHDIKSDKPIVACVVGRWKAKLSSACGHAGSLAGSGDDAFAKEKWFMEYFGTEGIFTPEDSQHVSKKGALVTNIAHIPEALTKVMALNDVKKDFEPTGNLDLKCWFANNNGVNVPAELDIKAIEAAEPYNQQIEALSKQVGAQFSRETLKDTSGASMMDPKTQVSKIHNESILDASKSTFESNLVFSLIRQRTCETGEALANIALNGYVNMKGHPALIAAEASKENGNSPNTVVATGLGIIGKKTAEKAMNASASLLELFQSTTLTDVTGDFDFSDILGSADAHKDALVDSEESPCAKGMLEAINKLGGSVFTKFCEEMAKKHGGHVGKDTVLAAIWTTIGWAPLRGKKITKDTLVRLPWNSKIFSALVGVNAPSSRHGDDNFCGVGMAELATTSFTKTAFMALLGRAPSEGELYEFQVLLGLIITNGPGTISAQGSKGAVSADGPEDPSRVQLNKAFIGFLTHTGFAHGGNGYEAAAFLMEKFKDTSLTDPSDANHGIDLEKIAVDYANEYGKFKKEQKAVGNLNYGKIPCVNHPVFKGKDVNYDPREQFVSELFKEKGLYNVFLDFYHHLVQGLFKAKVTKNVYCVNVDAVIAVILLKMVWKDFKAGTLADSDIETASFATFLFGRMIGCAAEIDDHTNRGKNMDTRTPASKCSYVG
jgi:succinyl-CoA synthetase alpha subunit